FELRSRCVFSKYTRQPLLVSSDGRCSAERRPSAITPVLTRTRRNPQPRHHSNLRPLVRGRAATVRHIRTLIVGTVAFSDETTAQRYWAQMNASGKLVLPDWHASVAGRKTSFDVPSSLPNAIGEEIAPSGPGFSVPLTMTIAWWNG